MVQNVNVSLSLSLSVIRVSFWGGITHLVSTLEPFKLINKITLNKKWHHRSDNSGIHQVNEQHSALRTCNEENNEEQKTLAWPGAFYSASMNLSMPLKYSGNNEHVIPSPITNATLWQDA